MTYDKMSTENVGTVLTIQIPKLLLCKVYGFFTLGGKKCSDMLGTDKRQKVNVTYKQPPAHLAGLAQVCAAHKVPS